MAVSGYATLPPIGPTVAKGKKVLWYLAKTVAQGVGYLAYEAGQEIQPTPLVEGGPDATRWARFVVLYDDTTDPDGANSQQFSLDVVNFTNGAVDSTWTQADFSAVQTSIQTFVGTISADICSRYTYLGTRGYNMAFNDYDFEPKPGYFPPFATTGPPAFLGGTTVVSTGTATVPPQCTSTITERTPDRAHWGRLYLPTISASSYAPTTGRLSTAVVDSFANAYATMLESLRIVEMHIVVPTTRVNRTNVRTLQHVTGVSCDDVADVHRSRRHKLTTYRKIL